MKKKIDIRLVALLVIISLLGLWRVLTTGESSSFWNFTPIGAMALFAGAYFSSTYKSYALPLAILFISDIILMQVVYAEYRTGLLYSGWAWTYGSFVVMVFIGRMALKKVSISTVLLGSFLAALAHYVITDLGVWLGGGLDLATGKPYAKDWEGLVRCYVAAIPFFKNILMANLVFGTILFGGFEWAQRKLPILRTVANPPTA